MSWALFVWVMLTVVAAGMVLQEHLLAEEELDATVAALTPQARCGTCGDTFGLDEVELHYLLLHPDTERRQPRAGGP